MRGEARHTLVAEAFRYSLAAPSFYCDGLPREKDMPFLSLSFSLSLFLSGTLDRRACLLSSCFGNKKSYDQGGLFFFWAPFHFASSYSVKAPASNSLSASPEDCQKSPSLPRHQRPAFPSPSLPFSMSSFLLGRFLLILPLCLILTFFLDSFLLYSVSLFHIVLIGAYDQGQSFLFFTLSLSLT